MGLDFLVPIFGILIVLVPVTGATLIMTLRLGGKPFIETLAKELKMGANPRLEDQIAALTDQVESLTTEVRELRSVQSFDKKLLGSRESTDS
ncbi:MAG: hypothetical protein HKO77_06575 [Gemmatimonadetes bacterium]|nr:hypothetical protein [Gemmatimonadota bacterium]